MSEIQDISEKIDFKNLTYYFTSPNLVPINFIGFRVPLNIYKEIKNSNISIKKAEGDQNEFKSSLSQITIGDPKYKWKDQLDAITFIIQDKKSSIYLMIMLKSDLKLCLKQSMEQDLKY